MENVTNHRDFFSLRDIQSWYSANVLIQIVTDSIAFVSLYSHHRSALDCKYTLVRLKVCLPLWGIIF